MAKRRIARTNFKKQKKIKLEPKNITREEAYQLVTKDCGCKITLADRPLCLLFRNPDGSVNLEESCSFLLLCRDTVLTMNRYEKRTYITEKFNESIQNSQNHGAKFEHRFTLINSRPGRNYTITVCRGAFCTAYDISNNLLDSISKSMKSGETPGRVFNDSSNIGLTYKEMKELFKEKGVENPSHRQIQLAILPNTIESKELFGWFEWYSESFGDKAPNKQDGQIEFSPCEKREIYDEYKDDMLSKKSSAVKLATFCQFWIKFFPYVKIREYKAVTGKCETCTVFTDLRRKYKDAERREEIVRLFAFHRASQMGERLHYRDRIRDATGQPTSKMSVISDGMQQAHSQLPYVKNQREFTDRCDQHLQVTNNFKYILLLRYSLIRDRSCFLY